MLKRINDWWMGLEPGEQYMYWIITFCLMLLSGIAILSGTVGMFVGNAITVYLFLLIAGIACFIALFMAVVLFLTVIWPHRYQQETKHKQI